MHKIVFTLMSLVVLQLNALAQSTTDTFNKQLFTVYKVAKGSKGLAMFWKNKQGEKLHSLKALKTFAEKDGKHLLFATNGGMYTKDNAPVGLYIENGQQLTPIDTHTTGTGNFTMQPNGIFLIAADGAHVITTQHYTAALKCIYATQSGPMLVIDGNLNDKFKNGSQNLNIRSGVGVDAYGNIFFAISNQPVNFYDFAVLFKNNLYCPNALYLDGAISKMYLPEQNKNELGGDFGVMIGVVK